jgi:hypothetical protein
VTARRNDNVAGGAAAVLAVVELDERVGAATKENVIAPPGLAGGQGACQVGVIGGPEVVCSDGVEVAAMQSIGGSAENYGDTLDAWTREPLADVLLLWVLVLILLPGAKGRLLELGDGKWGPAAGVVGESGVEEGGLALAISTWFI